MQDYDCAKKQNTAIPNSREMHRFVNRILARGNRKAKSTKIEDLAGKLEDTHNVSGSGYQPFFSRAPSNAASIPWRMYSNIDDRPLRPWHSQYSLNTKLLLTLRSHWLTALSEANTLGFGRRRIRSASARIVSSANSTAALATLSFGSSVFKSALVYYLGATRTARANAAR
jgi:hypothetical protein